jgi:ribosomal protein S18 acetylase RimI-like enzyme
VKLSQLPPAWRTDFTVHAVAAEVTERADCVVVRTPGNPTYYWGNCLLLEAPPGDDELAHWLRRFDEEIAASQPASQHVALGVNTPYAGEKRPAWEAAGFELHVNAVMRLLPGGLVAPPPPKVAEVEVRPIAFDDGGAELEAVIELQCADTHGFELAGYRRYRRRMFEAYARLHERGQCEWFGVWVGTGSGRVLAADCGLLRDRAEPGATGRFQRVSTHPAWRRRGLCSALVQHVSRHALQSWQVAEIIMVADPDDVAIGIYRGLGYREFEREWCLERRAPVDRPALIAAA